MRQSCTLAIALAVLAALAPVRPVAAAYLQSDVEPSRRVIERHRPIVRPRPRPNPVRDLAERVETGNPTSYRGLTVFPLVLRSARTSSIWTLDEALSGGWLDIVEKQDAQVAHVRVRNRSGQYVFLMAGEILAGGKQDRIVRDDVLLPPNSRAVDVPVYCGEQDRWTVTPGTFRGDGTLAAPRLRRMAAKAESQGSIWSEIDSQMKQAGVASATRSYRQVYLDGRMDSMLREYAVELRRIPRGQTVGAVFVSRGRIVGCDLFTDPGLLDRLWDKICRSYASDLVKDWHAPRRHRPVGITRRDVQRFLERIADARIHRTTTPGVGDLYRLGGAVDGHALTWRSRVVHCGAFPGYVRVPVRPYLER